MISTRSPRKIALRRSKEGKTTASDSPRGTYLRSIGVLIVACLVNPCCAPLWVPLALAFLAGTPLAVFLSASLGWVYGGLTILFLLCVYLGWRWLPQRPFLQMSSEVQGADGSACAGDCACSESAQERSR